MRVVVDASVALKWFFRTHDDEADVEQALDLLRGVADDRVSLVQPVHFIAEVAAVLVRQVVPQTAHARLRDLLDVEISIVDTQTVYARAMRLSARHDHHLFDTLYHAVALETDAAVLVTADDRYARKARSEGGIVRLADFVLPRD